MEDRNSDKDSKSARGMTRRRFIKSLGTGAAVVSASGTFSALKAEESRVPEPGELHQVTLSVNGRLHRLLVEARWSLLFVLREKLGLAGTKVGCERGECGACTVLIDGVPRYACMTLAVEAQVAAITTVEGLMQGETLGPVQQAFADHDAFQCGYCTPGQIMSAEGFLRTHPDPTVGEIQKGMSGNLCRCGAYVHIFQAVQTAAKNRSRR